MMFGNDSLMRRFAPKGSNSGFLAPLKQPNYEEGTSSHFEAGMLKQVFQFGGTLGMEMVWSHARFHWSFPHVLAVYLLPDRKEREAALKHVEQLAKAIHAAETCKNPISRLESMLEGSVISNGTVGKALAPKRTTQWVRQRSGACDFQLEIVFWMCFHQRDPRKLLQQCQPTSWLRNCVQEHRGPIEVAYGNIEPIPSSQ